jgi:uncharacterized protein (TIGR02246 family)
MTRLISACCLTLLIACGQTPETSSGAAAGEASAAIRGHDSTWFAAHNAGDADAVAALYADDAVVSAPGVPPVRGSAAVREAIGKDIADMKAGAVTLVASPDADVGVSGDLAWIWNTFTVKDKSGGTVDAGKYLTVFTRKDGTWRITRDIWNSDNPPPAKPASAN